MTMTMMSVPLRSGLLPVTCLLLCSQACADPAGMTEQRDRGAVERDAEVALGEADSRSGGAGDGGAEPLTLVLSSAATEAAGPTSSYGGGPIVPFLVQVSGVEQAIRLFLDDTDGRTYAGGFDEGDPLAFRASVEGFRVAPNWSVIEHVAGFGLAGSAEPFERTLRFQARATFAKDGLVRSNEVAIRFYCAAGRVRSGYCQ